MKTIIILIIFKIYFLSILPGQSDSIKFLMRDWYAKGYADKNIGINDIIAFDTSKIKENESKNYIKWDFKKNGEFFNQNVSIKKNFGNTEGESLVAMSDDNLKWEIEKDTNELIIDYGNIEGSGNFKAKYKILGLSKSRLTLKKLNAMKCPNGK